MKNSIEIFKEKWQITKNWQLIYPTFGILGSFYLGLKISFNVIKTPIWLSVSFGLIFGYVFLKLCLFFINKLETKWQVDKRWELIRIFIIFAITGSSSMLIGRPAIKLIGITTNQLSPMLYWILFALIGLVFYQILLVFWGYVLGQFDFFWNFEKKMLRRFGLGRFLDKS